MTLSSSVSVISNACFYLFSILISNKKNVRSGINSRALVSGLSFGGKPLYYYLIPHASWQTLYRSVAEKWRAKDQFNFITTE